MIDSVKRLVLIGLLVGTVLGIGRLRYATALVTSGSMAPALNGVHLKLRCPDCRVPFPVDALAATSPVVCGNCGATLEDEVWQAVKPTEGTRTRVDRWRSPVRWQVAAFRNSAWSSSPLVKRTVGLPGETIEIRDGDLFADGVRLAKSVGQLRTMAVLVHDDRYSYSKLPPRWSTEQKVSSWETTRRPYRCDVRGLRPTPAEPWDWLVYHHWNCMPHPFPPTARTDQTTVVDHYPYNQGASRSKLLEIDDVFLDCQVRSSRGAQWAVTLANLMVVFRDRQVEVSVDGRLVATAGLPSLAAEQPHRWEIARCDGRLLVAVDRVEVAQIPLPVSSRPEPDDRLRPAAFGVRVGYVELDQLRVLRDLYYRGPGGDPSWTVTLARDEYLMLGDNVPISRDSRDWTPHGVARRWLIGNVIVPPQR